ncbi:protein-disulfide reductase DsbD [Siphonobacter sp. SORGH_AS_1065]|uniref:protein-disulfide reductase DsbD family protein n=1 Tax=Siphonobacter sp. SORGH_AS_1065 TaxID=3041795 RepID=UPI00278093D4|nr:cytochrome c biogenesis protein CcdA [Siphonobacter sp. SORGH_AS_1065]MDQ1090426.1 thiol:disulfide interchange protein [Siphonobacter sp. SORGH_AS_1065]
MKRSLFFLLVLLCPYCQAQLFNPVTWDFKAKATSPTEAVLTFQAKISRHWHIYSQHLADGGPVATSFVFNPSKEYTLVGKVDEKSNVVKGFDKTFQMDISWFENQALFTQKIKLTGNKATVSGKLEFMACDDERCLPPEEVAFDIPVQGLSEPVAAVTPTKPARDSIPQASQSLVSDSITIGSKSASVDTAQAYELPVVQANESPKPEEESLWVTFVAGLLGGLAAIFMPCIFPLLPMTVSFFTKQAESRSSGIRNALLYGLSIIVIYVSLGLLITVLFGADALNNLSTNGLFNFAFFLLLVVFAASFLGAFELMLPSSWANKMDQKADQGGLLGIFFMATTLSLVSFSCTGPIIGTLLVQAAAQGALLGPAIGMFGFALALALPFTLFSLFPSALKSLPKSGGWLNSVKVTLGILELALALKFLSNVDLAYHWQWFDREVFLVLWIILFAILGFYLLGKLRFAHDSALVSLSVPRFFLAVISLSFSLYMVPGLWGAPLKAIAAFLPPQQTQDFDLYSASLAGNSGSAPVFHEKHKYSDLFHAPLGLNAYFDYDEALAEARKTGKPLLIDFTGHACVNCRKMEATVWPDPAVLQTIREKYILLQLYVDDKTELAPAEQTVINGKEIKTIGKKWSTLQATRFQANSQPYYVLLDPITEKPRVKPQGANYDITEFLTFLHAGISKP